MFNKGGCARRVLIIGGGQLSGVLQYGLHNEGWCVDTFLDKFTDRENDHAKHLLEEKVKTNRYDEFIWCVAATNTRACENDFVSTSFVNVSLPLWFASVLAQYYPSSIWEDDGPRFSFIGSGCIFDNNREPQHEDSIPTPKIHYARQKLMAENVKFVYRNTTIIRPRMIFSNQKTPTNLLYKIAGFTELIAEQNSMTCAFDILDFIIQIQKNNWRGATFNYCNNGMMSPVDIKIMMAAIHDLPINKNFTIISKEELHRKIGLELTNTWIESKHIKQNNIPDLKNQMRQMIKCSPWIKDIWA